MRLPGVAATESLPYVLGWRPDVVQSKRTAARAKRAQAGEPKLDLLVHARPPGLLTHLLVLMLADFLPPLLYNGRHWRSLNSVEP